MKRIASLFLLAFVIVGCNCQLAIAQTALNQELDAANARTQETPTVADEVADSSPAFHRALIIAAQQKVKAGEMTRGELLRLRVAMMSPAFRNAAEDLAVIQMGASGSENVPVGEDGEIERASINWDAIIKFLRELIPIIMDLIKIFGGGVSFELHYSGGLMHANIFIDGHYFGMVA